MIVAILGTITAIAVLSWLLFTLAIYALPAFAGVAAALWAYQTGAGLPGSVLVGLVGAVLLFGLVQFLILFARPMWVKLAVALAFVAPTTHGIVKHLMPAETWQTVFSVVGAVAVGITAFVRVTSMTPSGPVGQTPASI